MNYKRYFADAIIVICIFISLVITIVTISEYHRLNTVIPAGVLTAMYGLWGGELLIIALRQIFGSDVITKTTPPTIQEDWDE